MKIRVCDLFGGIGGFRLGMEMASKDFEFVEYIEIDKYATQIYNKNFNEEWQQRDVTKLSPKELQDFEILCAGFPCQAFSVAGKRLGFEDTRGTLFFEIARIARQKRPRLLFLENVKGLLFHDRGRTFATILATLDELGYDVEWQVLNSKYWVPQNRERVFIIGHSREKPTPKIFPINDFTIGNKKSYYKTETERQQLHTTNIGAIDCGYPKMGGNRTMILLSHTKANIKERIQDRKETWTIDRTGSKIGLLVEGNVRMLTPLECERLQGFPDGFTEGLSDTQRYKVLGNTVTVPVIEYIGKEIWKAINEQ